MQGGKHFWPTNVSFFILLVILILIVDEKEEVVEFWERCVCDLVVCVGGCVYPGTDG